MILRYIYSACVVIENADVRICCDPWFTQGIYDGSWFQFPRVEDPIEKIGPVDYVFVSHIHPDHYDPPFLRQLLEANPDCQILIGSENQSFLRAKMLRDGFSPNMIASLQVGATAITVVPNRADSEVNIDSALVVRDGRFSIANLNDCPFDQSQIDVIKGLCNGSPDVACLPYAGAGPYPQRFRFDSEEARKNADLQKREQFLRLYERYLKSLQPKWALPFAGLYYLGGSLRSLNDLRAVPDATEVRDRFGSQTLVLCEGVGAFNLETECVVNPRMTRYDREERDRTLQSFDDLPFPYQQEDVPTRSVLVHMLSKAHSNAVARVRNHSDRWLCLEVSQAQFLSLHPSRPGVVEVSKSVTDFEPREVIHLDPRLLLGLLERRYHWNNAEIGSHFEISRSPETYDRRIYNMLNFLHV